MGRWGRTVGAVAVAATVSACGGLRHGPERASLPWRMQEGIASWYGPGFHGRPTATGEVFDQYDLTAAHPTLPLGSRILVHNLENGRHVTVRVNDRGPFVAGRILDLSYAAAYALDMVRPGTAWVRITVLEETPRPLPIAASHDGVAPADSRGSRHEPPAADVAPAPPRFVVQVAAFSDAARATHLRDVVAAHFPDAHVVAVRTTAGRSHRVRLGPYALRRVATARANLVARLGYPAEVLEEDGP